MNCTCIVCGSIFAAHPNWHHPTGLCSDICRAKAHKEAKSKYKKTNKGIMSLVKWLSSDRRKENEKRYMQQPHRKALAVKATTRYLKSHPEAQEKKRAHDIEYGRSEIGKETNKKARDRYNQTEHGKAVKKVTTARRRSADGSFTSGQWIVKLKEYDNKCAHCGAIGNLTTDHIIPLKLGGNNYIENIQPLCKSCNSKKGARYVG